MSELLTAASAALGIPEPLVERSAAARAAETGSTTDEVLAAWAGGAPVPATAVSDTQPTESAAEPVDAPSVPEPVIATPPAVTAVTVPPPMQPTTRAPIPDEVTPGEAAHLPVVITVPTAGIKERTSFVIPKWLTAVLIIVPLFALFALGGSATGECGEATELQTDVVTGAIVNCDGSPFTGSEIGGGGTDFIALGSDIYSGAEVAGVNCSSCHGPSGQGVGNFPALTGVLTTFGACADHEQWVSLGSAGWGQATYGDTNKPVGGGMPGFAGSLSDEQIAAVAAFERARFGGGDPDTVLSDCGLVEPGDGEGGDTAEASVGLSG